MASNKKSALTAALSGAPAAPTAVPKPQTSFRPVLDNYAFPCLQHAPDDGTPLPEISDLVEGLESIDLKSYTVVGSAPTRTSLPNGTPLVSESDLRGFPMGPKLACSLVMHRSAGGLCSGPLPQARRQGGGAVLLHGALCAHAARCAAPLRSHMYAPRPML